MELPRLLQGPWPGSPLRSVHSGWGRLALHLPAHGLGRGLAPATRRLLQGPPGSWDWPELPAFGGPLIEEGAVAEVQCRLAAQMGAERCWLGVNGASGLLQAALLAMTRPGDRVLLPRNLHRSLLHACLLGGLRPVLMRLPFDRASGLWMPPTLRDLEPVLAAASPLAAAVLVHPTYQGLAADLRPLVAALQARGLPVLVDEAHGAHFAAAPRRLPESALACGADLVVHSLHKSAGGLGQTAVLWQQGPRVQPATVERSLLWLQTSSPSALLLASGAAAIERLQQPAGRAALQRSLERAERARAQLQQRGWPLLANADPLRLVLITARLGCSGLAADGWLMERGVVGELPEPGCLTFCLGLTPPRVLGRRLHRAWSAMAAAIGSSAPLPPFEPPPLPLVCEPELELGQAARAASEPVALEASAGRWAAAMICPYPPGIPLLCPGERIDPARRDWLLEQRRLWPGQIADTVQVVRP
ncbi:aminotransferase class I/II-fold pyridoxal phosphate-dependent enzyme [Synechococcus sp. RSCCF101]|uniref:aminotransferase class I/II-fold pyridoxal phosphate-dependent enzyme n=1 Tax=Synechococcus sp. RSCCF101 TaxID=2511069 RepID=UPI001247AFB5|nr:aminotransferase class I/II-fold pyridoxal phosphate-dependent enzyme [Synechococcus sp. RSCCF101]QEY31137.1 aminotransferase class I/II-fold pyridoxal phosphate-dependent enzyme [Synechococcus sp. RSCCF101]